MFLIERSNSSENSHKHLILDKLMMPARFSGVSRPRLLDLLEKSLASCTSTIISARAGAGKTTLAVAFAQQSKRRIAWYKVDSSDGDLSVFLAYLSASIRHQLKRFCVPIDYADSTTTMEDRAVSIAERFVYELAESGDEPLLIVVEDLHLICDSPWLIPFVTRLLPLLPSHIHVLITCRTMPPAPLWRMRSKQTLTVIDDDTLKFNRAEAVELFRRFGLSEDQAFIALDHTRGRAAVLSSFAVTLQMAEKTVRRRMDRSARAKD
ncbi:MAG TPA: hypothetical protein VIV66_08870 [Pyrinomonadaceae bacterium]